jgi:DNA-binding transcriptional MerR regulator
MARNLTTAEVGERFRTPTETVRYWRHIGYGPPSFKIGRRVLYNETDVDAFEAQLRAADNQTASA